MKNRPLKSRFLTSTTAISVALATMQPFPLLAQDLEGGVTAETCVNAEGLPCTPEELELQLLLESGEPEIPEVTPEEVPDVTPEETPEPAPEPEIIPEVTPEPEILPEPAPEIAPETPPELELAPELAPEAVTEPEAAPEPEVAPEGDPVTIPGVEATDEGEIVPEAEPEVTPEVIPEILPEPEAAPEAAPAPEAEAAPEAAPEPEPAPQAAPAPEAVPEAEAAPAPEAAPASPGTQPVAEAIDPADIPVPTEEAIQSLSEILSVEPEAEDEAPSSFAAAAAAVAAAAAAAAGTDAPTDPTAPVADPTQPAPQETVTTVTEADSRSSSEEFATTAATLSATGESRRSGLTDFEKFGLVALGALAVGAVLNNRGDQVVSNTGDRVVVQRNDGNFYVMKDDDTLLRRPGSTVRTENYADGSTRTIVERQDGSRVITIRDASGRVLRRSAIDFDGREVLLIDDLTPVERIDVSRLPLPREEITISTSDDGASLRAALAAINARENARTYSLRQIRDYRQVRALAPAISVDPITFSSGSSAIGVQEAEKLAQLGRLLTDLIRERPSEVFLIEGHTDAVGSAASNLALSDRRAESVALALTEYFDVPPENLVVQGYGESDLLVPTEAAEQRNRRVAVRLITPILQQQAALR